MRNLDAISQRVSAPPGPPAPATPLLLLLCVDPRMESRVPGPRTCYSWVTSRPLGTTAADLHWEVRERKKASDFQMAHLEELELLQTYQPSSVAAL